MTGPPPDEWPAPLVEGSGPRSQKALDGGDLENTQEVSPPRPANQDHDLFGAASRPEAQPSNGLLSQYLRHDAHGALGERIRKTYPGQARWVDPTIGRSCRECLHWASEKGTHSRDSWGALKPQKCWERRRLKKRWGDPVPHDAIACPAFELNPQPPEAGR